MSNTVLVKNAGFEAREVKIEPVPTAGPFDFVAPPDWQLYDPNQLVPSIEGRNPGTSFVGTWESQFYGDNIPEGSKITSIFLRTDADGNATEGRGPVGLEQTLEETIAANTTYTLSASVLDTPTLGNPAFDFFGGETGYALQFVAGDQILATTEGLPGSLGEGGIKQDSVAFTTSDNTPYLGLAEKIDAELCAAGAGEMMCLKPSC